MSHAAAGRPRLPTALALPPPGVVSAHVQALARCGDQRCYRRGALIIQEGDSGDMLYIVHSGRLRVFVTGPGGKELTLSVHGPGEYVGEISCLDGGLRSTNVEAAEATECAVVGRAELLGYMSEHPDFALELMARLIQRVRLVTENARSVALIDVYGRLVNLLDRLAEPPDVQGRRVLRERLTHQQIASYLACSREMVSRLLKDLVVGGYVTTRARRLVLLKNLPAGW